MTRKAVWLLGGCAFLALTYLAIHGTLRPRYFAVGRIFLNLQIVVPTNEPAMSNWNWYVSQQASSNWHWYDDSGPAISEWNWYWSQPAISNWYCNVWHPVLISNLLSERMTLLVRDSGALDDKIQLVAVCPIRGTSLVEVRFSGNEPNAAWRVASNACAMLAAFYATNLPVELQITNQVTREVKHIDTSLWSPTPFWRRMLDDVESLFQP